MPPFTPSTSPTPGLSELWNLRNTGQTGGTSGADIDAVRTWDITRGRRDVVVVGAS